MHNSDSIREVNPTPAVRVPERNKKPGVCYALTGDGIELPVIDITHPAFACDLSADEISALIDAAARDAQKVKNTPPEMLRQIAAQSVLARGWVEAADSFMSGMITYLNRLGPDNLGDGYAGPIDRRMAAGLMATSFRFRLRDVARLIADALAAAAPDGRTIRLLNIAGGAAADSLNALILVRKEHPECLAGRRISIEVLDLDSEGPGFAGRSLAALMAENAPLHGLDVSFRHTPYNWSDPSQLRDVLAHGGEPFFGVCSSEGGLFDYGSDKDIVTNLHALHAAAPADFAVVGSVLRDAESLDPRLKSTMEGRGRPLVRQLGLKAFTRLALEAGWTVARVLNSVAHHTVLLKKVV